MGISMETQQAICHTHDSSPIETPEHDLLISSFTESRLSLANEGGLAGLRKYWKTEMQAGLIVFLIALPLCLGIAIASGVPPMAGIISAVIGGLLVSHLGGSHVTVNGPAAGLIVVVLASVERLGGGEAGYHATLAAIVISGLLLFVLGLFKAGQLADLFPSTVVHGMLAAIGIIIITKQLPFVLGVQSPAREPMELVANIPQMLQNLNPEIAAIGFVSLAILIVHGSISNKVLRQIPAPIIVVVVAILMGAYFDLGHLHKDVIAGHPLFVGPQFLVSLPSNIAQAVAFPDFSKVWSYGFLLSVVSITLVQCVESLLSASAVEKLDPFHRRANLSKDVAAVGLGSALSGAIGGLPIIAEIVRSTANISNGAQTRWSNFFHGAFMLIALIFCAAYITKIPLAALAALLVFTGYKLASPRVFKDACQIGPDQLIVFVTTIVATLTTDLLCGVAIGIAAELALQCLQGVPIRSFFKARLAVMPSEDDQLIVQVKDAAVFTNFMSLKQQLLELGDSKHLVLDFSSAKLIDHTIMEKLPYYCEDYGRLHSKGCSIRGLDCHKATSSHPFATRKLVN